MHTKIKGQEVEYAQLDLVAKSLLLKDGTRYTFDHIELYDILDKPNVDGNLIEVESLAFGDGKWMLGTESLYDSLENIQRAAHAQLNKARAKINLPKISLRDFYDKVTESPQLYYRDQSEQEDAIVQQINSEFFKADYVRLWRLWELLQIHNHQKKLRMEVCAAARFEGNDAPVLLRSFYPVASAVEPGPVWPEYFQGFAEAAEYAGVDVRTIKNWKKRKWLEVEQVGRKVRIARAELDKCK